jgi:hypothetical protein
MGLFRVTHEAFGAHELASLVMTNTEQGNNPTLKVKGCSHIVQ